MKRKITLILLLFGSYSVTNAQTTLTLQPNGATGKDALLHGLSSEVNTNYGNSSELPSSAWTFGGTAASIRSVLGFDLSTIPSNATITSAQLSLYAIDNTSGLGQHSTSSGPNDVWLERITSNWTESAVTWNTQPSTTTQNRVSLPASTSATQNYPNINVTTLVQDMVNNPSNSFGFMLKLQNETYYRRMNFSSSDHTNASLRPKLVITYTTSANTCITLQPSDAIGKDALLHGLSSEVDNNYGSTPEFPAAAWTFSGESASVRSLIDFDLSSVPTNATITSAQLSLYAIDNTSGMGQHSTLSGPNNSWLERVTSSWDESTVTWNTQPTTTTANRVSLAASTSPTQNYLNMNVTSLVQDIKNNPSSSFGLMLKLDDETAYRRMNFGSSDNTNSAIRPKLEVCYSIPTKINENHNADNSVSIYPNPANVVFTIKTSASLSGSNYVVMDQLGRTVLTGVLSTENTTINIEGLAPGVYALRVANQKSLKLIKK